MAKKTQTISDCVLEENAEKAIERYAHRKEEGLYEMGRAYFFGEHGKPDLEKATECFLQIEDTDYIPWTYMGHIHLLNNHPESAFICFALSFDDMDSDEFETEFSEDLLGMALIYARGVVIDKPECLKEEGHGLRPSSETVAYLAGPDAYRNGRLEIPQQPEKASEILRRELQYLERARFDVGEERREFWRNLIIEEGKKLPKPYSLWFKNYKIN